MPGRVLRLIVAAYYVLTRPGIASSLARFTFGLHVENHRGLDLLKILKKICQTAEVAGG